MICTQLYRSHFCPINRFFFLRKYTFGLIRASELTESLDSGMSGELDCVLIVATEAELALGGVVNEVTEAELDCFSRV